MSDFTEISGGLLLAVSLIGRLLQNANDSLDFTFDLVFRVVSIMQFGSDPVGHFQNEQIHGVILASLRCFLIFHLEPVDGIHHVIVIEIHAG